MRQPILEIHQKNEAFKSIEELRTLRALPCFGETDQTQIAKLFLTQLFEGVVPTVPFANRYEGVVDTLV
jgi:hypothetical protein